jgi:hypothetical protein
MGALGVFFMLRVFQSSPATAAEVDLDAPQKALVERLVLDRAASLVAVQRRADERERMLLADFSQKDRALRSRLSKVESERKDVESKLSSPPSSKPEDGSRERAGCERNIYAKRRLL